MNNACLKDHIALMIQSANFHDGDVTIPAYLLEQLADLAGVVLAERHYTETPVTADVFNPSWAVEIGNTVLANTSAETNNVEDVVLAFGASLRESNKKSAQFQSDNLHFGVHGDVAVNKGTANLDLRNMPLTIAAEISILLTNACGWCGHPVLEGYRGKDLKMRHPDCPDSSSATR